MHISSFLKFAISVNKSPFFILKLDRSKSFAVGFKRQYKILLKFDKKALHKYQSFSQNKKRGGYVEDVLFFYDFANFVMFKFDGCARLISRGEND